MGTTTNYLTRKQMTAAKSRLTRALNSKDPERVIGVVDDTFAEWDDGDYAYPDDWHRWNIARQDATFALVHGVPMR